MGKTVAALDIGGTSIKSGLWDGTRLLRTAEQDTNAKNGGAYVMERAIEILKSYQPFDAIGISTAGKYSRIYRDGGAEDSGGGIPCSCSSGK